MPAIAVRDLRKRYDETEVVCGVSFEVAQGEVFCLLGPNGAGKTTTTEVLEGYRLASAGEVRVLGHDPARRERALRERIGIVPQAGGLLETLTVAETLEMYGRPYPRPLAPLEVLGLVGLETRPDARVGLLSGGQRRRLELGVALVGDPDVVFLDEPTTGFDPQARRRAWETIRALGKTVLLTTHFMDEAQALADHIAVMVAGRIVAYGPPAEIAGRASRPAEISFRAPAGLGLADLPALTGAEARALGDTFVVSTRTATATAHALTGWALERGHELAGLAVSQPTLEDVYLELTTT